MLRSIGTSVVLKMNPEDSKAKKCLFGPPDHQQLQADLQEELNKDAREMNEKWDFDFQEGKPLNRGKFEWEAVEAPKEERSVSEESAGAAKGNEETENLNSEERHKQDYQTPEKNLP